MERTASIDILTDKLVELSEKERKASDLLYEARRAAEDNTENKEMLSLEQENKENEKEYERLKNEAAIFTEISEKLLSLKKKLNRIGFSCDLNLGDETLEKTVDERILEIKKTAGILADLEEIIKNHFHEDCNGTKHFTQILVLSQVEYADSTSAFDKNADKRKAMDLSIHSNLDDVLAVYKMIVSHGYLCLDEDEYYRIAMSRYTG